MLLAKNHGILLMSPSFNAHFPFNNCYEMPTYTLYGYPREALFLGLDSQFLLKPLLQECEFRLIS